MSRYKPRRPDDEDPPKAPGVPDDDDNDLDEVLAQCDHIAELIDEELPEEAYDKATEFFDDVKEKAASARERIRTRGVATDGERQALNNWEHGVIRWIPHLRD